MRNDPAADSALLARLQQGEDAALDALIERWRAPLHAFAYRYVQNRTDARDLAAETLVQLYRHRARLRPDTQLASWLFTTLANLCHNHHRWRRRHPSAEASAVESDSGPGPDQLLQDRESAEAVRAAIAALPHPLKVAVVLHHYEQRSYAEIAAICGCSERGVESRLYRARQRLRELLAPDRAGLKLKSCSTKAIVGRP